MIMRSLRHGCRSLVAAITMVAVVGVAQAQPSDVPRVQTIDGIVDEVMRTYTVDIKDIMAVLDLIFAGLPERVKVYPTENYFYFRFIHNGLQYAGNFRLDAIDRDEGKIQFGYYEELAPWKPDGMGIERYLVLNASHGVQVERIDPLVYRVTYKGKSVLFELNDLSQVKPPAGALKQKRISWDRSSISSAIRFFGLQYQAEDLPLRARRDRESAR